MSDSINPDADSNDPNSNAIEVFENKLASEEIVGIVSWLEGLRWDKDFVLLKHINAYDEATLTSFSQIQHTMYCLIKYSRMSVLDIHELDFKLDKLSEVELDELIQFYELTNPEKRYKQIKADITSPESFLTQIPYSVIKFLYDIGKVPFDRQIFVACMIRFNVWHGTSFSKSLTDDASQKVDTMFPKDDFSLDILMAVFEMELGVNSAFYLERDLNIGAIIIKLVNDGDLNRSKVQQKLFEAFNNPILKQSTQTWVKNVYDGLDFSPQENLACQCQLIELMYNDVNLISNFALRLIKKIATHKTTKQGFDWQAFIEALDGIVYRTKFNGGLKLAIKLLNQRFAKVKVAELNEEKALLIQACHNLAPIFIQEDSAIQAEAVKLFGLLEPISKTDETDYQLISEALQPFVTTMHSETLQALTFLLPEDACESSVPYEKYKQDDYTPLPSESLTPIHYIDNETDFIFLCTKVLKSHDGMDVELFLEGLLRYHYLKDTQPKALGSALKMAKRMYDSSFYSASHRQGIYHILIAKLICIWLQPEFISTQEKPVIQNVSLLDTFDTTDKYSETRCKALCIEFAHLDLVADSIQNNNKDQIILLNTPTHSNGSIALPTFTDRLNWYEKHNHAINEADFNIALCRLNRYDIPKNVNLDDLLAQSKLSEYSQTEYRQIVAYLIDDNRDFDNTQIKQLEGSWLSAFIIKNQHLSTEVLELYSTKSKDWWLATPKDFIEFGRRYSRHYSWSQIYFNIDGFKDGYYNRSSKEFVTNQFSYYLSGYDLIIADGSHWFLKDGYCLEPLYLNLMLYNFKHASEIEADEQKSVMATILESLKDPKPLGKNGMMYLCLSLFTSDKTVRGTALDWLITLIDARYLNLELFTNNITKMICNEHHPFPFKRVIEQFEHLKQMGGVTIGVLYTVIQSIVANIDPANLPRGFKSLLHQYYEVLTVRQSVHKLELNCAVTTNLNAMVQVNAVKKEAGKILDLLNINKVKFL